MDVSWRKSSISGKQGNCVIWKREGDAVLVSHSKRSAEGLIRYSLAEWQAFIEGVKQGEADL